MNLTTYLVIFSAIVVAFVVVMFCLAFGRFNNRVLKKSFLEGRVFAYVMFLTAVLYLFCIFYISGVEQITSVNIVVLSACFVAYAIAVMISLLLTFKTFSKIRDAANQLAKGKRNLQFDFEGAVEFESIASSLKGIQQNYKKSDKKLDRQENNYQKFVPKEYLKFFGKTKLSEVSVGDSVQVKLSVMFCDMRNSYYSSETLSLGDNFLLIKDFVAEVTKCIKKHNGFVDKYMGDGVLAIFENEDDALCASNEIAKRIDYKNIVSIGKENINYGISLNSGMCVVGVVGEERQKQFVVVSDIVNLCSRLEDLNKLFKTRVLMTKQFMSNLKKSYSAKYVGTIEFDDLTSKIPLFESLDAYEDGKKLIYQKTLEDFESGVRFFEKGEFEKAKNFFTICLKQNADDNLARLYLGKTVQEMSSKLTYEQK